MAKVETVERMNCLTPLFRHRAFRLLIVPTLILLIPHVASSQDQPNILMIVVDDLGYGDLSSYGAQDLQSPNIDDLVDSRMSFSHFYANSPVCSPTRASLMTGRFPNMVGVPGVIRTDPSNSWGYLNPGAVMLPEVLKQVGYHTAMIGKWHLGLESPSLPNERGFDYFHGFLGDMMDDYYTHLRDGNNYMRINQETIDPSGHATDLFTQWAVDFIGNQSPELPFFLYLAYNAPHVPIQPPQEWFDSVRTREGGISDQRVSLVALIEHLDDGIGQVMTALSESELLDNTLVIFVSDNGGQLNVGANNGPLNGGKADMLEGGIRVAMGAAWPGRIEKGSWSDRVAMTMDLFPTICDAAGAECNHEIDGRSLLPTLLGFPQPEEDRVLFWVRRGDRGSNDAPYYAARQENLKILQNRPEDALALYDLENDPQEAQDLGQDNADFDALYAGLQDHISLASEVGWQPGADAISPGTISLLEPNGGQDWEVGSIHDIIWSSNEDYTDARLEYTADGYTWQVIADSLVYSGTGIYSWTVLGPPSSSVKIRVSALGGNVSDVSDALLQVPEPGDVLYHISALVALAALRRRSAKRRLL